MADLQRDMRVRRRIEAIFNKDREDFPDLRTFGDYEEEKEDIIFNLCQSIDVDATEAKVAAYQRSHHEEILTNEVKKAEKQRAKLEGEGDIQQPEKVNSEADVTLKLDAPKEEAFQPMQTMQPSLPPPPSIVSQQDSDNAATTENAASPTSKMEAVGLVSGWHPDMPRRRALEEAYSSIFVL